MITTRRLSPQAAALEAARLRDLLRRAPHGLRAVAAQLKAEVRAGKVGR